jgi:hypothetical protein
MFAFHFLFGVFVGLFLAFLDEGLIEVGDECRAINMLV